MVIRGYDIAADACPGQAPRPPRPSSLKQSTYRVPSCSVTDARRPNRSSQNASAAANSTSIPRSQAFPGRSPVPSQPRQRPEPSVPARRGEERSRRSRSPHRAPLRRIRLRMPNALLPAAAGQYPKAQGRRGTTHPRAVPSAVRDWLAAGHGTDRQRSLRQLRPLPATDLAASSWHAKLQVLTLPPRAELLGPGRQPGRYCGAKSGPGIARLQEGYGTN